jgi:hypothetical protein
VGEHQTFFYHEGGEKQVDSGVTVGLKIGVVEQAI